MDFNGGGALALKVVEEGGHLRRLGEFRHQLYEGALLSGCHALPAGRRHFDREIVSRETNDEVAVYEGEGGGGDRLAPARLLEQVGHRLAGKGDECRGAEAGRCRRRV